MTKQLDWNNQSMQMNVLVNPSETTKSSWISRLMVIWLAGIGLVLPIKILNIPYNFELVDIFTLGGIPIILFLLSIKQPKIIGLSYTIPMWLVLVSSFLSIFVSTSPRGSMIVVLKEVYLFVWFLLVTVVFFQLKVKDISRVLRFWGMVVTCHGLLMIAQFLWPAIWQFTNSLGGNTSNLDYYRAAGLFICDAAGCANKAAYYQIMGFVPVLLGGFSKRMTVILGIILFMSILCTGSMGGAIAFLSGLVVTGLTVAFAKKNSWIPIKFLFQSIFVLTLLGAALYISGSLKPEKLNHFERIMISRFERSSEGRLDLWQRGIDVLKENKSVILGVGPDNFRLVDPAQTDNQLHNDALAFLVERGLLGLLSLVLLAAIALRRAVQLLVRYRNDPKNTSLEVVVFPAVLAATIIISQTHQIFHARELWLVLAVQEAVFHNMSTFRS